MRGTQNTHLRRQDFPSPYRSYPPLHNRCIYPERPKVPDELTSRCSISILVLYPGNNDGCRASQRIQDKAQSAGNGRCPFQGLQRRIGSSGTLPLGSSGCEHPVNARSPRSGRLPLVASAQERVGKRPPAVLRLWARAKAIPGEARLAFNRLPTRCIRNYYLDRVLDQCKAIELPDPGRPKTSLFSE